MGTATQPWAGPAAVATGVPAQTTLLCEFCFMSRCGAHAPEQHLPARGNAGENGLVTPKEIWDMRVLPCSCCTAKRSTQISVPLNSSKVSVLCPSCDWPNTILYFPFYFTVNDRKYNGGLLEFCIYSLAKAYMKFWFLISDLNRNALCDDPLRCMKLLSTVSPISVNLQALLLKVLTECDQAVHFGQSFGVKKKKKT